jgi:hypothetical protein
MAFSPLAAFTLIAAPAVLTNAVAVLALSTSNRFSRTLDRARGIAQQLDTASLSASQRDLRLSQFERAQVRSFLLLKALSSFYLSLATLAISSVISIVGTVVTAMIPARFLMSIPWIATIAGSIGVTLLAYGCTYLVRETRLAVSSISEEADHLRRNFRLHNEFPEKFD